MAEVLDTTCIISISQGLGQVVLRGLHVGFFYNL